VNNLLRKILPDDQKLICDFINSISLDRFFDRQRIQFRIALQVRQTVGVQFKNN